MARLVQRRVDKIGNKAGTNKVSRHMMSTNANSKKTMISGTKMSITSRYNLVDEYEYSPSPKITKKVMIK